MLKKSLIRTILVGTLFPGVLLAQAILDPEAREKTEIIEIEALVVQTSVNAWDNRMEGLLSYLERELDEIDDLFAICDAKNPKSFNDGEKVASNVGLGIGSVMLAIGKVRDSSTCLQASMWTTGLTAVGVVAEWAFTRIRYADMTLDLFDSCGKHVKRILIKRTTREDRQEIGEFLSMIAKRSGCKIENIPD